MLHLEGCEPLLLIVCIECHALGICKKAICYEPCYNRLLPKQDLGVWQGKRG